MAGTRTAPDFAGAATGRVVTMSFVDVSNDVFSIDIGGLPTAASDAEVEAIAAAMAAATQSSLYQIKDSFLYRGAKLASNAESGSRDSIKDGINILYRSSSLDTVTIREPAPVAALMVGDTDAVDVTATLLLAINTAIEAAVTGYTAESAQFTERRERSGNSRDGF